MARNFPAAVSLSVMSLALVVGAPQAAFADKALTPYEKNLVCKLSGTCDAPSGDAAKPTGSGDAARDVGQEAAFSVYQGSAKSGAPANSGVGAPPASRNGLVTSTTAKPKFGGGLKQSARRPGDVGYGVHGTVAPGRMNAADVRVLFGNGSAELDAHGMGEISHFAHALEAPELATKHFVVEGHTNSIGGRDYNLDLSQRRAQTVVDYLVKLGVDASRLQAKGYGFDNPRLSDPKAAGNRRVEVVKAD